MDRDLATLVIEAGVALGYPVEDIARTAQLVLVHSKEEEEYDNSPDR